MRYEFRKYIGTSSNYELMENVALPFSIEDKLNEEKDEAIITIVSTEEKNRIPKNTRIEIVEIDSGLKYQFVVVKDTVTRVSMSKPYKYNHDILLIESSALLENIVLPSLSFSRNTGEYITISSSSEFENISLDNNGNFRLTNDIEIDSMSSLGDFYGTINGMGYTVTINNLNIDNEANSFGIFNKVMYGALITNINFNVKNIDNDFEITSRTDSRDIGFGIVAGSNYGIIEKTKVINSRIGVSIGPGVYDSTSNSDISIGGLVGVNYGEITRSYCDNTRVFFGSRTIRISLGGMVGKNYGSVINSFVSNAEVSSSQSGLSYRILQGGFIGQNMPNSLVKNCYSFNVSNTGGRVIQSSSFIPDMSKGKNVSNCYYWPEGVSGSLGISKSEEEMKESQTYQDFDFNKIWKIEEGSSPPHFIEFEPVVFENPLRIYNVLDRLLLLSRTRFKGETPEFLIHPDLASILESVEYNETSEFYFNELNLWEALLEIGGKINAIPYLEDYKYVNYLFLNKDSETWEPVEKEVGYTQYQAPEAYATNLISFGKNLVVSEDKSMGSIEYPYKDGFMTPRSISQQSIRITKDTSVFWVGMPIYDIERVLLVNVDNSQPSRKYDITKYIYTKEQYSALPDTDYGQGLALIYDQYGEYIYGLQDTPIAGFVPEYPALRNILINGLGIPSENINTDFKTIGFNIRFRTNFDNIQNTVKRSLEDFPFEADLLINQTVNQVSSSNWGEYKNYKMDKLGNIDEVRKFIFQDISEMPKVGDRLSNEKLYVNKMVSEFYPGIIVCEISFTKNFQKISEYISVNSRKRPFQIAIDNIQDRHIKYQEFVRFSKSKKTNKNENEFTKSHITDTFMRNIFYPLGLDRVGDITSVSSVRVQTYDVGGGDISDLILPVSSYAQPRGLLFTTKMYNNISAGYYADTSQMQGSDGYSNRSALYARDGVADSIKFNYLYKYIDVVGTSDYIDVATQLPKNPDLPFDFNSNSVLNQDTGIEIIKDNREKIFITTHIHFVNEEQDIIIGNALTYNNIAIKESSKYEAPKLYVLDRELEDYEFSVPIDAVEQEYSDIFTRDIIDNDNNLSGVELVVLADDNYDCSSWFLADGNKNILIGMQGELNKSNSIYAFKQLRRSNFAETFLAASIDLNNIESEDPFSSNFNILISGNNVKGRYSFIDYGDGILESFEFDSNGLFEINYDYIPEHSHTIKIYTHDIRSIETPYYMDSVIKNISIYNDDIQTLTFHGNYYGNIEIESINLRLMKNLEWVDFGGVDSLHSINIDDVNNLRYIDLSHTGLVDEENALLNIIDHLKDYSNEPNINAEFRCVGTQTPLETNYWPSVMNALTAKGWNYVYNY